MLAGECEGEKIGFVARASDKGSVVITKNGALHVGQILAENKLVDVETLEEIDCANANEEEIIKNILSEVDKNLENEIESNSKAIEFNEFEMEIAKNERFFNALKSYAKSITKAVRHQSDIIVRYHADADGISGALAVKNLIESQQYFGKVFFIPLKTALYDSESVENDSFLGLGLYKPVMICIDFSPTKEALEQLKFETIVIDHHPTGTTGLNPWSFGEDSNITAGLISSLIAKIVTKRDHVLLEKISLTGDRSRLLASKEDLPNKLAVAFDYLAMKEKIDTISKKLNNEKELEEVYSIANAAIQDTLFKAEMYKKVVDAGDFKIYIIELREYPSYPSAGKLISIFHEKIKNEKAVSIAVTKNALSVRVGQEVLKKVDVFKILEELNLSYGGHKNAFSIKKEKISTLKKFVNALAQRLRSS